MMREVVLIVVLVTCIVELVELVFQRQKDVTEKSIAQMAVTKKAAVSIN